MRLGLPSLSLPSVSVFGGALGAALAGVYYVDDAAGNDSNDGLAPGSAWASLSKIEGISGEAGKTTRVMVAAGTYNKATDHIEVSSQPTSSKLEIVFAAGSVIDFTAAHDAGAGSPIYAGESGTWTMDVKGNGLTITGLGSAGGSPNGLGYGGAGVTLIASDITIDGLADGISGHNSGHATLTDVTVRGSTKSAVANVTGSTMTATDCIFEELAAASGDFVVLDGAATFTRPRFVPVSGPVSKIEGDDITITGGIIGTLTEKVRIEPSTPGAASIAVSDAFINVYDLGDAGSVYTRCFGRFSTRFRETSGGGATLRRSIIIGAATGQTAVLESLGNPAGQFAPIAVWDCIFSGAMTFDTNVSNAQEAFMNNVSLLNNILHGGAVYSQNLLDSDAAGSATITGTITLDPLIGDADTYLPDDWAFGSGSPAIGAASDGNNVGFGIGVLSAVAHPPFILVQPTASPASIEPGETLTLAIGAASGFPDPTTAITFTVGGVDKSSELVVQPNGSLTWDSTGETPGAIVWQVTWTNSEGSAASNVINATLAAPLVLYQNAAGQIISTESGDFTVTITEPAHLVPGSPYAVTEASVTGDFVMIGEAATAETPSGSAGQSLTALMPGVVMDAAIGPEVYFSVRWLRSGVTEVGTGTSYTTQAADLTAGLSIEATAIVPGAPAAKIVTSEIIAAPAFVAPLVTANGGYLTTETPMVAGSPTSVLALARFVVGPSATLDDLIIGQGDGYTLIRMEGSGNIRFGYMLDGNGSYVSVTPDAGGPFDYGDEITALTTREGDRSRIYIHNATDNSWTSIIDADVFVGVGLRTDGVVLAHQGQGSWPGGLRAFAYAYDLGLDISDPNVRAQFVDPAQGALINNWHALYGPAEQYFHGPAADWNAGLNKGSGADATKAGGNFA